MPQTFSTGRNKIINTHQLADSKFLIFLLSLKKFHEKAGGPEMEPCRNRGLCEVRSRLAQTPIYRWIPSFM